VTPIPVERITQGSDAFFCVPYSCKLTARSCVERRVRVRAGVQAVTFAQCKGCELGAAVERNSGLKVRLKIHRPKYGVPKVKHGQQLGRGPRILELTREQWLSYEEIAKAVGSPKGLTGTINQLRVTQRLEHRVEDGKHVYRALDTDIGASSTDSSK
jgi:hypothetical protein